MQGNKVTITCSFAYLPDGHVIVTREEDRQLSGCERVSCLYAEISTLIESAAENHSARGGSRQGAVDAACAMIDKIVQVSARDAMARHEDDPDELRALLPYEPITPLTRC